MSSKSLLYIELPYEKLIIEIENKKKSYESKKHWHERELFSKKSIFKLLKNVKLKLVDFKLDVAEGKILPYANYL